MKPLLISTAIAAWAVAWFGLPAALGARELLMHVAAALAALPR